MHAKPSAGTQARKPTSPQAPAAGTQAKKAYFPTGNKCWYSGQEGLLPSQAAKASMSTMLHLIPKSDSYINMDK